VSIAIVLILVAWLGYYGYSHRGDFAELTLVSPWLIVVLALISLVSYFAIAILNNVLLRALKVIMPLGESFMLSIVTGFYNLITPFRGGMAVRAVYLKKKYDFAYVNFLASLSAVYVLTFLVGSLLGIISTLLIYFQTGIFSWVLFGIFDAVFLAMLIIIFVSPQFKERKNKWLNRFIKVINGWHLIKKNGRVILVTSFVTLIQILLSSLMMWLQFRVFGLDVSFTAAVFLSAIGSLSILIGLTPGNLGVQEAIVVFSAATIGISATDSLSAALLGRAVSLVVLFVLGPIFSYVLLKRNGKNKDGKGKKGKLSNQPPQTEEERGRKSRVSRGVSGRIKKEDGRRERENEKRGNSEERKG